MIGNLRKMVGDLHQGNVSYQLRLDDQLLDISSYIGQPIKLVYTGNVNCVACGRKTKKSFSQGHCFPCSQKLACCDMCIMKPETCHYHQGTCREPQWGEQHCMIPHYVYLANTSGIKVGITRHSQIPTRWIDQGATQALPIFKVNTRQQSGLVEVALAEYIADKTNWRTLLKGNGDAIDLSFEATSLIPKIDQRLNQIRLQFGDDAIEQLSESVIELNYPVAKFPAKISSHNFDKNPEVIGTLEGIKGQYLMLDTGVINVRKFSGYQVQFDA